VLAHVGPHAQQPFLIIGALVGDLVGVEIGATVLFVGIFVVKIGAFVGGIVLILGSFVGLLVCGKVGALVGNNIVVLLVGSTVVVCVLVGSLVVVCALVGIFVVKIGAFVGGIELVIGLLVGFSVCEEVIDAVGENDEVLTEG